MTLLKMNPKLLHISIRSESDRDTVSTSTFVTGILRKIGYLFPPINVQICSTGLAEINIILGQGALRWTKRHIYRYIFYVATNTEISPLGEKPAWHSGIGPPTRASPLAYNYTRAMNWIWVGGGGREVRLVNLDIFRSGLSDFLPWSVTYLSI